jgi:tRNA(Ile)-lysidine synthase
VSDPQPQPSAAADWSADHLRLHRHLRRHPALLPDSDTLLLAVSGGQDSMALVALLTALQRLHGWRLHLWHGDHGWRPESGRTAQQLAAWAAGQGLPLLGECWQPEPGEPAASGGAGGIPSEAAGRAWRYRRLAIGAAALGASRVVTGHTASDRAETLLFNLARGSHRRGLASLRGLRALEGELQLARPLLPFSRADTGRLCRQLQLPVWPDPSNNDQRYSRNRLRQEVLPVLEALHPGAARRLAALAEQLAADDDAQGELLSLALAALGARDSSGAGSDQQLPLAPLRALQRANQGALLQHWLSHHLGEPLSRRSLETLLDRLAAGSGAGTLQLAGGWRLQWQRSTLALTCAPTAESHGREPRVL